MLDEMGIIHERFQFENYLKEIYLDSETSVALLSTVPFEDRPWLITNEQMALSRELVNGIAGSRRMLTHSAFTPGRRRLDGSTSTRPSSASSPIPGRATRSATPSSPANSKHPWRLDDEKLVYPFYEKIQKAGINTVCVHKGLIARDYEKAIPGGLEATRRWTTSARRPSDWPGINFVIYHSALRPFIEIPDHDAAEFEKTGYIRWVSDLAQIPEKFGVNNVYGEIGTSFANTVVTHRRVCVRECSGP